MDDAEGKWERIGFWLRDKIMAKSSQEDWCEIRVERSRGEGSQRKKRE